MKSLNKYDWIFLGGIALWLIETMAFGWNMQAQSTPEWMFDAIAGVLMLYGFIAGIVASLGPRTTINCKELKL
jgi:hypothetical protein